uniref:Putative ubiquitin-conjugating enzyme e2 n=1 Tax=Ixodes ricinus TaxID=34613 RepID=A0A6B0TV42_IXORI
MGEMKVPSFRRSHGFCLCSDAFLVLQGVLTVDCVRLSLRGIFDVGFVEQVLDSEQDLFDGDGRSPVLLLVQQREAHRS